MTTRKRARKPSAQPLALLATAIALTGCGGGASTSTAPTGIAPSARAAAQPQRPGHTMPTRPGNTVPPKTTPRPNTTIKHRQTPREAGKPVRTSSTGRARRTTATSGHARRPTHSARDGSGLLGALVTLCRRAAKHTAAFPSHARRRTPCNIARHAAGGPSGFLHGPRTK